MIRSVLSGHLTDVGGLVKRPSEKGNGESFQARTGRARGVVQDGRGVDPAAEPNTQRDVRKKMLTDRFLQKMIEFLLCRIERAVPGGNKRQGPISLGMDFAISPFKPVPRGKLFDPVNERPRARNIVQGQVTIEPCHAQAAVNFRVDQDGLELGPEKKLFAATGKIKRLD